MFRLAASAEEHEPLYAARFVIPVPEEKKEAYRQWAEMSARFFKEVRMPGNRRVLGGFRSRRQRDRYPPRDCGKAGREIVFTWQVWPDKASFTAAEEKTHKDARMDAAGEPPFDAKRLILGCFQPIFEMGR